MKTKWILTAYAVVFTISGIASMVAPKFILTMWGIESEPGTLLTTQYDGVGALGLALLSWFLRDVEDPRVMRPIILGLLISGLGGLSISILGMISGVMKTGLPVIILFAVFCVLFTWSLFAKKS
jgi:hypothetical protein